MLEDGSTNNLFLARTNLDLDSGFVRVEESHFKRDRDEHSRDNFFSCKLEGYMKSKSRLFLDSWFVLSYVVFFQ